jgi:hypothetical protein
MLRFRRMRSLQKFAALHRSIHNHFNQERTLISRQNFASQAFGSRIDAPPYSPCGVNFARPDQREGRAHSETILVCLTAPCRPRRERTTGRQQAYASILI